MDAAEPPLVAARPSHALRSKPSMKRRKAPALRTIQTAGQGAGAAKDDNIGRRQPSGDLVDAKEASPPKPLGKVTRKVSATGRPIVPLTEQKSISRTLSIGKRDEERDRWDVVPDGASAGREGRQFTVANVGNNGKLFLRYACGLVPTHHKPPFANIPPQTLCPPWKQEISPTQFHVPHNAAWYCRLRRCISGE